MSGRKTHLHSEQFDGHPHAACCSVRNEEAAKIVSEDDFDRVPRSDQCRICARSAYPHGWRPNDNPDH